MLFRSLHLFAEDEPVDIWDLEKKSEEKSLDIILENEDSNEVNIKVKKNDLNNSINIIESNQLEKNKITIVGLYDPEDNGLKIDMFANKKKEKSKQFIILPYESERVIVDRLRLLVYLMKIDLILAIETSSTICGVAVIEKEHTLSVVEKSADRKHAEILPEFIETALEKSQKTVSDLDAIAVSIGPGTFTGLRIGLGTAKGLAYSHDLPIVPVPTLASMALGLQKKAPEKGISFSHGKRIFYQEFNWKNNLPNAMDKPLVGDIDEFSEKFNSSTFQWNCESIFTDTISFIGAKPSAEYVALLAYYYSDKWLIEKPYDLVPEYIAPFEMNNKKI